MSSMSIYVSCVVAAERSERGRYSKHRRASICTANICCSAGLSLRCVIAINLSICRFFIVEDEVNFNVCLYCYEVVIISIEATARHEP